MARRRPAFLKRSIANEDRRRLQARDESRTAGAAFRWAAIGVAIVIGLGVMVAFTDHGGGVARWLGGFAWLARPVVFGLSAADLLIVLPFAAFAAFLLWRDWRRTRL